MADQFSAQLQAMRKERDGALRRGDRLLMQMDDLRRKHTALQAQLAEARGLTEKMDDFTRHRMRCPMWGPEGRPPCSCGLANLQESIRALAQREPSEATQEGGGDV